MRILKYKVKMTTENKQDIAVVYSDSTEIGQVVYNEESNPPWVVHNDQGKWVGSFSDISSGIGILIQMDLKETL